MTSLRDVGEHLRRVGRSEIAAFVAKQRAAHALFERMQRAMHADRAHVQRLGRLRRTAGLHEGEQHFQFTKGDFVVDSVAHVELWNGRNRPLSARARLLQISVNPHAPASLRRVPAYVMSGLAALSVAMLMMPQPVPHGRVVELTQQLCAAMLPPIVADREDDAYREHRAAHCDAAPVVRPLTTFSSIFRCNDERFAA